MTEEMIKMRDHKQPTATGPSCVLQEISPDEKVFGATPVGQWWVSEYMDGTPSGGEFFETEQEARAHIALYESREFLSEYDIPSDTAEGVVLTEIK